MGKLCFWRGGEECEGHWCPQSCATRVPISVPPVSHQQCLQYLHIYATRVPSCVTRVPVSVPIEPLYLHHQGPYTRILISVPPVSH